MILETAAVVSAAKPLVEPFVEKYVTSKLQSFAEWCKKKHKEVMIPTSEHFQEYLERTYDKYCIINTLVFHNSQRKLKDIYVDQTIIKENHAEDDEEKTKIEGLPVELIKKYQKILITDTAGMGKSTIMKRMFVDLIDKGLDVVGIPIYIELNRLNKSHTILTEIQEELNSLSEEFDNVLLLKLIQTGGFIFFLDGFDEISIKDRSEVTIDVHTFISKAGNKNYYILTSRPESGLASFGDFQSFTIQPLTKDEAFVLLEKYDLSKKKELSRRLVELLKSGQYNTIDEYLVNPLLVSLLYTAYDYNQSIPFEKHRFYGVVFDAYFEKHDSSKPIKSRDKLSGLNHDGFDSVLRYVGYKCLTNIGVKFDEDTILNTIREARSFCGNLSFAESDFLKDLVSSVPLFCKEGTDYKWLHKSLLEYFAARFVFCDAKRDQDAILSSIHKSGHIEKYINMLDIYYDIDYKGFSKNIMLPVLEQYVKYHDKHYPKMPNLLDADLVEARIGLFSCYNEVGIIRKKYSNRDSHGFFGKKVELYIDKKFSDSKKTGRRSVFFGRYDAFLLLGFCNAYNSKILSRLIHIKKPELFNEYASEPEIIDENLFKDDKIYKVELTTGSENKNMFLLINSLLSNTGSWYYNYDVVKHEIKKVKEEIEHNNTLDLLSGL
jgi:hypothetical protein